MKKALGVGLTVFLWARPSRGHPDAMGDVKIDTDTFKKRIKLLYDSWKVCVCTCLASVRCWHPIRPGNGLSASQTNRSALWEGATSLVIPVGATSDDLRYLKSISLHLWLFGYELPGGRKCAWPRIPGRVARLQKTAQQRRATPDPPFVGCDPLQTRSLWRQMRSCTC